MRIGTLLLLACVGLGSFSCRSEVLAPAGEAPAASTAPSTPSSPAARPSEEEPEFPMPRGRHVELSCSEARAIVAHADKLLAFEPQVPRDADFGRELLDWLDPYGHWSAGRGAKLAPSLRKQAGALLSELLAYGAVDATEGEPSVPRDDCEVSERLGQELERTLRELRHDYERGERTAKAKPLAAALTPLPGAGAVREYARELGVRSQSVRAAHNVHLTQAIEHGVGRWFPGEAEAVQWGGVLRTAAVRAYVRLIDAHGGWAPRDEALSIYDLDLLDMGPMVLWQRAEASIAGSVVREGALPPLKSGDLVLRVDNTFLAGLPPEQVDELSIAALTTKARARAQVYRDGQVLDLELAQPTTLDAEDFPAALELELIPYGSRQVAVVRIRDVYDYLGIELGHTVHELRKNGQVEALLLDLRDNGGGAMDGALDALAHFLPGLPMFPMQNRSQTTEVDLTRTVTEAEVWHGPVATLVDGGTASAAEMIAGALSAYGRGPVVGSRTFGKGCIQEYVDDASKVGVFRLTTSLYALPDGTPVQRVGLQPELTLPDRLIRIHPSPEREASLGAVGPAWRGPDVRPVPLASAQPWPSADGVIGPCVDPAVCRALSALGRERRLARAKGAERSGSERR